MIFWIIGFALLSVICSLIFYACCVVSGHISRREEELEETDD